MPSTTTSANEKKPSRSSNFSFPRIGLTSVGFAARKLSSSFFMSTRRILGISCTNSTTPTTPNGYAIA